MKMMEFRIVYGINKKVTFFFFLSFVQYRFWWELVNYGKSNKKSEIIRWNFFFSLSQYLSSIFRINFNSFNFDCFRLKKFQISHIAKSEWIFEIKLNHSRVLSAHSIRFVSFWIRRDLSWNEIEIFLLISLLFLRRFIFPQAFLSIHLGILCFSIVSILFSISSISFLFYFKIFSQIDTHTHTHIFKWINTHTHS